MAACGADAGKKGDGWTVKPVLIDLSDVEKVDPRVSKETLEKEVDELVAKLKKELEDGQALDQVDGTVVHFWARCLPLYICT